MKRREFITLLGGAAAAWPLEVRAEGPALIPVVGFLHIGRPDQNGFAIRAFERGLSDAGFVVGNNVDIDFRWANYDFSQLPPLAADLVDRQVAVLFTANAPAPTLAAKAVTATIPIVFFYGGDPVKTGSVASWSRPGGNVTGVTGLQSELGGKRLSILHELVPQATTVALLTSSANRDTDGIVATAQTRELQLAVVGGIRSIRDLENAFETVAERQAGALMVTNDVFFIDKAAKLVELAERHGIPTIYPGSFFVRNGGLISYGTNVAESYRQAAARFVGPILKGSKPADLPIQRPSKFELVINVKTAKALGLTIPRTLLAAATELID
jgi:putative ABC transport system substrate-binding protein